MRTPAQLEALAAARRQRAVAAPRTPPAGYRSVEHFLDTAREFVGSHSGYTMELARYLNVTTRPLSRWLKREKIPMQPTLDAIERWMRIKQSGL